MSDTLLFFGDSNTRGYGVGRERRFATLVERALAEAGGREWSVVVGHSPSDFREFRPRLDRALERHPPGLLVLQCPTGPASWFVAAPPWLRALRQRLEALIHWRERRLAERARRRDPERYPSALEASYEGLYLGRLYRFEPRRWGWMPRLNVLLARRYGLAPKASRERYLERMLDLRTRARAKTDAPIVFLGLLPADERIYVGYRERVTEWTPALAAALDDSAARSCFVDPVPALGWDRHAVLLADGTHLTVEAHRRIAALLIPRILATLAPEIRV